MADNPLCSLGYSVFSVSGTEIFWQKSSQWRKKAPSGGEKPARIGRRARLFSARCETAKLSASSSFLIERIKKQSPVLCFNRSSNLVLYSLWSIVTLSQWCFYQSGIGWTSPGEVLHLIVVKKDVKCFFGGAIIEEVAMSASSPIWLLI